MISIDGHTVEFQTFPNGETRLIHNDPIFGFHADGWIDKAVFKYESDADLIKLMIFKRYLDVRRINLKTLIISYMPYSRMDRSENDSPFTLKYVSEFINNLNFISIVVIEPHSDVTCALLNNAKASYINFHLIDIVKSSVSFNDNKDYLVFPDAGAKKRYSKMKSKNILFCDKVRDFNTGDISRLDLIGDISEAKGKNAIIVDDLCSYGGTFIATADRLREAGFNNVYLLVAHAENAIFEMNEKTGKQLFQYIGKIFTTNSLLSKHNNIENKRFEPKLVVYDVESLIPLLVVKGDTSV